MLDLFGQYRDFKSLSGNFKNPDLEGWDKDENHSNYYHDLQYHPDDWLKVKLVEEYDRHIKTYTDEINKKREVPVRWRYYQYFCLLFTEFYLDKYFGRREELCRRLNDWIAKRDEAYCNQVFGRTCERVQKDFVFKEDELNKLSFWCATASGKTLLMHVHLKQYNYYAEKYAEKYHAPKLDHIILLTPNEGLSKQHYEECVKSDISAVIFSKNNGGMYQRKQVEIIDVNKLSDEAGDKRENKTVNVDSFEGNNLVLVDEGHRGSTGKVWMNNRKKLTERGFSFEYSATFGQVVGDKLPLLKEYGKSILFDYSYKYFYDDGFGKDYNITNKPANQEDGQVDKYFVDRYFTAYLMLLYEQLYLYDKYPVCKDKFLIAKPLGAFVGTSVTKKKKKNEEDKTLTDIIQIVCFLRDFLKDRDTFIRYIQELLEENGGIKDQDGKSVFGKDFKFLKALSEDKNALASLIYEKILRNVFHSGKSGGRLHIVQLQGENEEIGLKVGDTDTYFGNIYVGNVGDLVNKLSELDFPCEPKQPENRSSFKTIEDPDSPLNLLIGAKKFMEGWNTYRLSVMGLMNVGRNEGSQIIQLFGRGVRLKGYDNSMKRSSRLTNPPAELPEGLSTLETLYVLGVKADYMDAFKKVLKKEGIPDKNTSSITYEEIGLPVLFSSTPTEENLPYIKVSDSFDFMKNEVVHLNDESVKVSIQLDETPKVQAIRSKEIERPTSVHNDERKLKWQLDYLDWTAIFFELERKKNEWKFYNLLLDKDCLKELMKKGDWYELIINSKEELDWTEDYAKDVEKWQRITVKLLGKYMQAVYKKVKTSKEQKNLQKVYLQNVNVLPNEHKIVVKVREDKKDWIKELNKLKEQLEKKQFSQDFPIDGADLEAIDFDRHVYNPLLCIDRNQPILVDETTKDPLLTVTPVALNKGEGDFVKALRTYYGKHEKEGWKMYLLRNQSKTGVGFFEDGIGFYPDFILWIIKGKQKYMTFIDPKGLQHIHSLEEDPKIQLFRKLREEIQPLLKKDLDFELNSFILSGTSYGDMPKIWSKEDYTKNHVLFMKEEGYIESMMKMIGL